MWSIIAQLTILTMISVVIPTISVSAGGIVQFNLIPNIRSFFVFLFFSGHLEPSCAIVSISVPIE